MDRFRAQTAPQRRRLQTFPNTVAISQGLQGWPLYRALEVNFHTLQMKGKSPLFSVQRPGNLVS